MATPFFLCKTDLAGLVPVALGDRPAIEFAHGFRRSLAERCGAKLADLFAEPILGADGSSIGWYSAYGGQPQPLNRLESEQRRSAETELREQLAVLAPLLSDSYYGPILAPALHMVSADTIMVVDGHPVLANWGFVPGTAAGGGTALADNFARTLGPYALFAAPPVELAPGVELDGSKLRGVPGEPGTPAPQAGHRGRLSDGAPDAPTEVIRVRTRVEPVSGDPPPQAAPTVVHVNVSPPAPPPPPLPPIIRYVQLPGPASWRAALVAVLVAAAILVYLTLPDALRSGGATGSDAAAAALQAAKELNDALGQKIAMVEAGLNAAICGPDGSLQVPGGSAALPPTDPGLAKPPPGAPPSGGRAPATFLDYVNNSVVMVVVLGPEAGHGSGFFIGPRTIVTNNHVVKGADPAKIFAISHLLGKATPVKVVTTTGTMVEETKVNADFAVLQLPDGAPDGAPVPLSAVASQLEDVVAAGFPGINVESDQALEKLFKGDASSIPEMVASPGAITQLLEHQEPPLIAINTPIAGGNSGGPLVDYCGRVLGVNTYVNKNDNGESAYYALAAAGLMHFLDSSQVPYTKAEDQCTPQSGLARGHG